MKLLSNRDKDRTHLRDLIGVGGKNGAADRFTILGPFHNSALSENTRIVKRSAAPFSTPFSTFSGCPLTGLGLLHVVVVQFDRHRPTEYGQLHADHADGFEDLLDLSF